VNKIDTQVKLFLLGSMLLIIPE